MTFLELEPADWQEDLYKSQEAERKKKLAQEAEEAKWKVDPCCTTSERALELHKKHLKLAEEYSKRYEELLRREISIALRQEEILLKKQEQLKKLLKKH